jgi:hypothetical protein
MLDECLGFGIGSWDRCLDGFGVFGWKLGH